MNMRIPMRLPDHSVAATRRPLLALQRPVGAAAAARAPPSGLTAPEANAPVAESVGKAEGKLNLIAWEGYAQPAVGQAVREADRLPGERQVRRLLQRDGLADGQRRRRPVRPGVGLRRRRPAPDLRRRRAADQHQPDPVVEEVPPVPAVARRSTRSAASTTASPTSSVPTCCSTRPRRSRPRRPRGRCCTPRSTRARSPCRTTRSRSPTRRCTCRRRQPSLGITDPYELTQPQFNAAVALLKAEHPLIKKYWDLASQEISLFQSGTTVVGAAWPYQTNTLKAGKAPSRDTIPSQGATGWADTLDAGDQGAAPELRLQVDAVGDDARRCRPQEAIYFGETPANTLTPAPTWTRSPRARARPTTPTRRGVLQDDQVLEDAARAVRQRQERLRAVPGLGRPPGRRSPADARACLRPLTALGWGPAQRARPPRRTRLAVLVASPLAARPADALAAARLVPGDLPGVAAW